LDKLEYKLSLELSFSHTPPTQQNCVMCNEQLKGASYRVVVEKPTLNILYFEETCFQQLIAIGFKYYQEQVQEPKN
jgi:hypothetical protein